MIAYWSGLVAGLSLIVAIGAQNAFIIRQALTRQHVFLIVTFAAVSDALLIAAGTAGLGAVIEAAPVALEIIRWFGVAYLLWFAYGSIKNAFKGEALSATGDAQTSVKKIVATIAGLTFLNPHVYLDTVIFLGAIGNQFTDARWLFAFGAMTGSFLWFYSLGYGAKSLSKFMARPIFWKVLDLVIAGIMIFIAAMLAFLRF
ncbi:MAG: LysE/ArgO family amino acid transporter [Micrococcales bacterium]